MSALRRSLCILPDLARCRASGRAQGAQHWSLARLIRTLAAGAPGRPVSVLASRMVVAASLWEVPEGPYGRGVHEPAFARGMEESFQELKLGGVRPAALEVLAEASESPRGARLRYLARVFTAYQRRMDERGWCDVADLWAQAARSLAEQGLPFALQGYERIEARHLRLHRPLQRELFLALARACEAVGVEFELGVPGVGVPSVDAVTDSLFAAFEAQADLSPLSVVKDLPPAAEAPLLPLATALFDESAALEGPGRSWPLELWSSPDVGQEAERIARDVQAQVAAGVSPQRLAVVLPRMGTRAARVVRALEARGVRAHAAEPRKLLDSHVGRLGFALLRIVDDAFPAAAVAELLSSRYVRGLRACARPGAILREAGVRDDQLGAVGARGAYAVRLEAHAQRLDADGRSSAAAEVRRVAEACARLISLTQRLGGEARLDAWVERWREVLRELGVLTAAAEVEPWGGDDASSLHDVVMRAASRERAAARSLEALIDECQGLLAETGLGGARATRRGFERFLLDAMDAADAASAPSEPQWEPHVQVVLLEDALGLKLDAVWVAGLDQGAFPRRPQRSEILTDEDRLEINRASKREVFALAAGEGEDRGGWEAAEDRWLLGILLASVRDRAVLSWSPEEPDAPEALPSPLFEDLRRTTGLVPQPAQGIETVSVVGVALTEAELRARAALALGASEDIAGPRSALDAALATCVAQEPWMLKAQAIARIERDRRAFFLDPDVVAGPHTGAVRAEELAVALKEAFRFGPDRPLSASGLGEFGNCGFQGFLHRVLHLAERSRPSEAPDARARGSFWHRILERLMPRLAQGGWLGRPLEEVPAKLLEDAVAEAAREAERDGPVGHPALWRISRERAQKMLQRVLDSDHRGLPFDGHRPSDFELSFGRADSPAGWREVKLPAGPGEAPIWIEGVMDRVDRSPDGGLAVLDYKSSKVEVAKAAARLLASDFQLPLYLLAARAAGHEGPLRAGWLSLRQGDVVELADVFAKAGVASLETLLAKDPAERERVAASGLPNLANAVHEVVGKLRRGDFATRPLDCSNCGYQAVCRIPEPRVLK